MDVDMTDRTSRSLWAAASIVAVGIVVDVVVIVVVIGRARRDSGG